ncbi:MAG: GNAT family N-acetyltransferase [Muribaculaceae bacterium]|nr:GNAT family N-acetyltransferase [Muribaculaceae bacterium]
MLQFIREVNPDTDAQAIAAIYKPYVDNTTISFETVAPDADQMRSRILDMIPRYPYYVWEEDGAVLGYCYAHPWKERPAYSLTLETTIYLSPVAIGRGIGRELMNRLIGECRRRKFHSLIACITAENTASCAFHENLGFAKVSHFRGVGYKLGRLLDVADYQLIL